MKQAKPQFLNRTQINALIARLIAIHNEKVDALEVFYEKENVARQARYKQAVTEMLSSAKLTPAQQRDLVTMLCDNNDSYNNKYKSWSINAICGKRVKPELSKYEPKTWRCECHPLHKVLEEMRFELVMATAQDYEKRIRAMTDKIDAMLGGKG
jgi:hypothetical protein